MAFNGNRNKNTRQTDTGGGGNQSRPRSASLREVEERQKRLKERMEALRIKKLMEEREADDLTVDRDRVEKYYNTQERFGIQRPTVGDVPIRYNESGAVSPSSIMSRWATGEAPGASIDQAVQLTGGNWYMPGLFRTKAEADAFRKWDIEDSAKEKEAKRQRSVSGKDYTQISSMLSDLERWQRDNPGRADEVSGDADWIKNYLAGNTQRGADMAVAENKELLNRSNKRRDWMGGLLDATNKQINDIENNKTPIEYDSNATNKRFDDSIPGAPATDPRALDYEDAMLLREEIIQRQTDLTELYDNFNNVPERERQYASRNEILDEIDALDADIDAIDSEWEGYNPSVGVSNDFVTQKKKEAQQLYNTDPEKYERAGDVSALLQISTEQQSEIDKINEKSQSLSANVDKAKETAYYMPGVEAAQSVRNNPGFRVMSNPEWNADIRADGLSDLYGYTTERATPFKLGLMALDLDAEQLSTFKAIYDGYGKETAFNYLDGISAGVSSRGYQAASDLFNKWAGDGAGGALASGAAATLVSAFGDVAGGLDVGWQKLTNGERPIDYSLASGMRDFGGEMRSQTDDYFGQFGTLDDLVQSAANKLGYDGEINLPYVGDYSLATIANAAIDSGASLLRGVAGSKAAGAVTFFGKAGTSYADSRDRGAPDSDATLNALLSGAAEGAGEAISLEFLKSRGLNGITDKKAKQFIVGIGYMFGENFVQEAATEKMDQVFDDWTLGEYSKSSIMFKELVDSGVSPETAQKMVNDQQNREVLDAGIIGGFSGSMMYGTQSAVNYGARKISGSAESRRSRRTVEEMPPAGLEAPSRASDAQGGKPTPGTPSAAKLAADERRERFNVSDANDTYVTNESGERNIVTPLNIKDAGTENATVAVKDDAGNVTYTPINDVEFRGGDADVYAYAANMPNDELANAFITNVDENTENKEDVFAGMQFAYERAMEGRRFDRVQASILAQGLSEGQLRAAFDLGANNRNAQIAKEQAAAMAKRKSTPVTAGIVDYGTVNVESLSDVQKQQVSIVESIAKASGIAVKLFESQVNEEGSFVDENGALAPNGTFDTATGAISIDVNAGRNNSTEDVAETTIVGTLSHEMTHAGQLLSPAQYNAYRDMVIGFIEDSGESVDSMIERQMATDRGVKSREDALDEIVANASSRMLLDSDYVTRLFEARPQQAKTIGQKVVDFLHGLKEKIKAAFSGNTRVRKEYALIESKIDQLIKPWSDMMADATRLNESATVATQVAMEVAKAPKPAGTVGMYDEPAMPDERHIDRRTWVDAEDASLTAFVNDYKMARYYMAPAANALLADLDSTVKAQGTMPVDDYAREWIAGERITTDKVAYRLDGGVSYAELNRILGKLAAAQGDADVKFNDSKALKRIELVLNDMLSNGYETSFGTKLAPDRGYLEYKASLPGADSIAIPDNAVDGSFAEYADAGDVLATMRDSGVDVTPDAAEITDANMRFSVREEEPPQNTVIAYKLLRVKKSAKGELFPLFVSANESTPIGVWLNADIGETTTTDKGQTKVKSKLGNLAFRPGWHLGDLPYETHIGKKGADGKIAFMKDDHVWCECEVAADVDYQPEANAQPSRDLKKLPIDGMYRFKTNPNMTGEWIITGAMKINRVLTDDEVRQICADNDLTPLPRANGRDISLSQYGLSEYAAAGVRNSARDEKEDYSQKFINLRGERNGLRQAVEEAMNSDDFKQAVNALSDKLGSGSEAEREAIKAYRAVSDPIAKMQTRIKQIESEMAKLDEQMAGHREGAESEKIAKSGKSPEEYYRAKAVKEFGHTSNYNYAGYILPNGKMLNFGGEGNVRGQDHRAIGTIYPNGGHTDAMIRFMNEGSIRIMAESPGVDISTSSEPTRAQYATIRNFVDAMGGKQFFVDLSDASGRSAGSYEYEGRISPAKVVADIQYFFENGETRPQSDVSRFRYSARSSDAAYLAAVERGDMDAAQEMVDEAAKAAGYTLKGYHGTSQSTHRYDRAGYGDEKDYKNKRLPFTVFKTGQNGSIYMATNRQVADAIKGRFDGVPGTTMGVFVRFGNPFTVKEHIYTSVPFYYNIPTPSEMRNAGYKQADVSTEEISAYARENGYDGVIIEGIREGAGTYTDDYIAFSSNQIKLSDPVTYSPSGSVIPLSERFNAENEDIRYSARESDAYDPKTAQYSAYSIDWLNAYDRWTNSKSGVGRAGYGMFARSSTSDRVIGRGSRFGDTLYIYYGKDGTEIDALYDQIAEAWNEDVENGDLPDDLVYEGETFSGDEWAQGFNPTDIVDSAANFDNESAISWLWERVLEPNDIYAVITSDGAIVFDESLIEKHEGITQDEADADVMDYRIALQENTGIRYSTRDPEDISSREVLATALEGAAQNERERKMLKAYKEQIGKYDGIQKDIAAKRARIKELTFGKYERTGETRDELAKLKNQVSVLWDQLSRQDKRLLDLEAMEPLKAVGEREKAAAVGRVRAQMNERIKAIREQRDEKVEATKQAARDRIDRMRQGRKDTEIRGKIKRLVDEFNKKLMHPTDGRYVPKELIRTVVELGEIINTNARDPQSERTKNRLAAIRNAYADLKSKEGYENIYDAGVEGLISRLAEKIGDKNIYQLDNAELKELYETMKVVRKMISDAAKVFNDTKNRTAFQLGQEAIEELRRSRGAYPKWIEKFISWNLSSRSIFERFGNKEDGAWSTLYEILNEGTHNVAQITMESNKIFSGVLDGNENLAHIRKLQSTKDADLVDVGLRDKSGKTVKITRGMMLSLYMHLQNPQNARHVYYGGMAMPNLKEYYDGGSEAWGVKQIEIAGYGEQLRKIEDEIKRATDPAKKAELEKRLADTEDAGRRYVENVQANIEKLLSGWDRKMLAATREYYDGYSKKVLNDATMIRYGFEKAGVDGYFPIHTDPDYRDAKIDAVVRDMTLEAAGFMKERVNASNPILLEDLADVTRRQIDRVAQYAGMIVPLSDFQKVYNVRYSGYSMSLQKAITTTYGKNGKQYVDNLISDIQGARRQPGTAFDKAKGQYAKAILTLNISSAMKQVTAYPTAASVLGWKATLKALGRDNRGRGMIRRADRSLIDTYSPVLYLASRGLSSVEMGDIRSMMGWDAKFNKAIDWLQKLDAATRGRMWSAAEYYVDENFPDLQKGTPEQIKNGESPYYIKVAKMFNKVIEDTQQSYSATQLPEVLRSPNALVRGLTMFMSQPLKNMGVIYDASVNLTAKTRAARANRNEQTQKELREARAQFINAATGQIAAMIFEKGMTILAAMILHRMNPFRDDEDEITWESVLEWFGWETFNTVFGSFALGGEIAEIAQSFIEGKQPFDIEVGGISSVNDFVQAISRARNEMVKMTSGEYEWPTDIQGAVDQFGNGALVNLGTKLGNLAGVPAGNVVKMLQAAYYHTIDAVNGEFGSFEAGLERSATQNYQRLIESVLSGDTATAARARADLVRSGKDDEAIAQGVRNNGIKPLLLDGTIDESKARDLVEEYGGKTADEAYWIVKGWQGKAESDDGEYNKYDTLRDAVVTGKGVDAARKELTDNGVEETEVMKQMRSAVRDAYINGDMGASAAQSALTKYGLADDANDAFWKIKEWDFKEINGNDASFSRFNAFLISAPKGGTSMTSAAKELLAHGYEKSAVAREIAGKYKNQYLSLKESNPTQAAIMIEWLLDAYEAIGYDRDYQRKYINKNWKKDE